MTSRCTPNLWRGLPASPTTDYAVFIARKQWQKVAQAAQDPQDPLIVEGYPTVDPRFQGYCQVKSDQLDGWRTRAC